MDSNGVGQDMIQERNALYRKREMGPLPVDRIAYRQRQRQYARRDGSSTQVGGRKKAPHHWKYQEPNSDGELGDPDATVAPTNMVWAGRTW